MTLSLESAQFLRELPPLWKDIRRQFEEQGYFCTLVGGTVRDYFLTDKIGKDWDVEVTHETKDFEKEEWRKLGQGLTKFGKVSFLSYEVIRLDTVEIQYEFSPPRIETFLPNWEQAGHSNFTATFDFKLDFFEAARRRDFTINAIGIRFQSTKEVKLLDPYNGLLHLRDKVLHHCSEDFKKDPVRFLRAIRFSQKMNFKFTHELEKVLEEMPIKGITPSYLWSELQKSQGPVEMLKKLVSWQQKKPELKLPVSVSEMSQKWDDLSRVLSDPSRHEIWMIALEWVGVGCENWRSFFSVSSETAMRLARWANHSKSFLQLKPEMFQGEFEEIRQLPDFEILFDWYFNTKNLMQKYPYLPLLTMIAQYLPEWIHLYRFEALKDLKHIEPPLRAKYQLWNLCQRL